jgi:NAD(P)-dependent dehydrogenase (short-subunit alcohol dehydrogenase family)
MQADFRGDVAFVTGASGGMGRVISLAFATAGARVVMADVDAVGGAETERLVREASGDGTFVTTDVADATSVAAAVRIAIDRYGRLDCAVNAAAIENETASLHECDDGVFDRMHAINVRGVFLSLKYEIEAMLAPTNEGRGGAIVNIASTNSFRPQHDQPAYTSAKHAVLGLTRSAAYDYAPRGIRINAICPGSIDTPMLRSAMARRGRDPQDVIARLSLIGRFGRPDEIASAALFLCSDAASFVYGHPLAVDAGYLAR